MHSYGIITISLITHCQCCFGLVNNKGHFKRVDACEICAGAPWRGIIYQYKSLCILLKTQTGHVFLASSSITE